MAAIVARGTAAVCPTGRIVTVTPYVMQEMMLVLATKKGAEQISIMQWRMIGWRWILERTRTPAD
jgi:hypothetical protein